MTTFSRGKRDNTYNTCNLIARLSYPLAPHKVRLPISSVAIDYKTGCLDGLIVVQCWVCDAAKNRGIDRRSGDIASNKRLDCCRQVVESVIAVNGRVN